VPSPPQANSVRSHPSADEAPSLDPGVRSQVLRRVMNEQIRRVAESFGLGDVLDLVCECENGDCFAPLAVSADDYQAVRRFPTRFLVRPEHLSANERVVEEGARYLVVEKVGAAAETAILLDRRNRGHQVPRALAGRAGPERPPLSRLRCAHCGYGASCRTTPERCPMCGSSTWTPDHRRPLITHAGDYPRSRDTQP
jgi:rubrerythrin